jgi:Flp pilus assembly protein TadG
MKPTASSSAGANAGASTRRHLGGNTGLEFTMIGIPLVFVLISTVEMARAMWAYNSLGHSVRDAVRFAIRAGENCSTPPNDCATSVSAMATRVQQAAFGIPVADLNLTLTSGNGTTQCNPSTVCVDDNSAWPPAGANAVGDEITIAATYTFRPAIAMLWPGSGSVPAPGAVVLRASSTERIQF